MPTNKKTVLIGCILTPLSSGAQRASLFNPGSQPTGWLSTPRHK